MAKQTIIDWQRDGLLVAICQGQGASVRIQQVSEQRIGQTDNPDDRATLSGDVAQALSRAVDALGARKSDVTVVLSRELVEVRTLPIPRVDAEELPDLIRFQAQRQLANMGDNWILDYVLLPQEPGQEMLTALVGVISPAVMNEISAACASAGMQPLHVLLRPIEIARFALQSGKLPRSGASLVVCMSEQQADLLILSDGQVVQVRGTKLPGEASLLPNSLGGELRRSLMAAANHMAHQSPAACLLIAESQLASQVQATVTDIAGCEVVAIDALELLGSEVSGGAALAHQAANRLAGIAGATSLPTADPKSRVDFKDPKKRPPPKSKTMLYVLAAAAGLLLVVAGYTWWSGTNRALDEELAFYQGEVESKKDLEEIAKQRIADLRDIQGFLEGTPNWLEELTYIAENMPPANKVLMGEPTFSVLPDGTGRISMPVALNSQATIGEFEASLRDENHSVTTKNIGQLDRPTDLYKWEVNETVLVKNSGWKLVDQLDATRSAAEKPDAPQPASVPEAAAKQPDEQPVTEKLTSTNE